MVEEGIALFYHEILSGLEVFGRLCATVLSLSLLPLIFQRWFLRLSLGFWYGCFLL